MKTLFIYVSISTLFFCILTQTKAQWNLEKNEEGIKVFTRTVDGSNYKEFKAEMVLEYSAENIIKLIKDADNFDKWIHNCKNSKLLKRVSNEEQFNYTESELPFPFENRDMVFKARFSQMKNIHRVKLEGVRDFIPEKRKITRMDKAKGGWELIELENNKTKVIYQLWVEPGGSLPAWLANLKVVEIPFETLKKMRKQLGNTT